MSQYNQHPHPGHYYPPAGAPQVHQPPPSQQMYPVPPQQTCPHPHPMYQQQWNYRPQQVYLQHPQPLQYHHPHLNPWMQHPYYQQQVYPQHVAHWTHVPPPQKKSPVGAIVGWTLFVIIGLPLIAGVLSALADPTPSYQPPSTYEPSLPTPETTTETGNNRPKYPETDDDARAITQDNSLYNLSISSANCQMPRIDLTNSSMQTVQQQADEAVDCLMQIWGGSLDYDDYIFERPSIVVYNSDFTGKCGVASVDRSHYCSADNTIYFSMHAFDWNPPDLRKSRFAADETIAHEFGHVIQAHARILRGEHHLRTSASSPSEALDYQRRLELQSECLAGLSLNSLGLSTQDQKNLEKLVNTYEDPRPYEGTHGTRANYLWWLKQGLNSRTPEVCNTFVVSAEEVS